MKVNKIWYVQSTCIEQSFEKIVCCGSNVELLHPVYGRLYYHIFGVCEVPFIVLCSYVVIFLVWGHWVIYYLIVKAVTDSSEGSERAA